LENLVRAWSTISIQSSFINTKTWPFTPMYKFVVMLLHRNWNSQYSRIFPKRRSCVDFSHCIYFLTAIRIATEFTFLRFRSTRVTLRLTFITYMFVQNFATKCQQFQAVFLDISYGHPTIHIGWTASWLLLHFEDASTDLQRFQNLNQIKNSLKDLYCEYGIVSKSETLL